MKNYLAIVSSGQNVMMPKHKIVLWDVEREMGVSEINFKSEVMKISGAGDQM